MSQNNNITLLNQIISQDLTSNYQDPSHEDRAEHFATYTTSLVLKDYELSHEEIEKGCCDGSRDGGIDFIYLLVNGRLIDRDETEIYLNEEKKIRSNIVIDFIIIQNKNTNSFKEDAILKLTKVSKDLLNWNEDEKTPIDRYNNAVIDQFKNLEKTFKAFLSYKPLLKIKYFYITKGEQPSSNVLSLIDDLKKEITSFMVNTFVEFHSIGCKELMSLYYKKNNDNFSLKLTENPLSSQGKVFIALANLKDYFTFITDSEQKLIKHIFESNVRDYQGSTNVNKNISSTLERTNGKEDFWWLNNGVTILANEASAPGGKELSITNPEIVNGLQTTNEIYNYFKKNKTADEGRNILVRVIVPQEEESRSKIIKATNSQTILPHASLRATDTIHRDIEEYLKPHNLFYDRRKNYHKLNGKKSAEIVSLPFLAQCLTSITMQKPQYARAKPSTLLIDDKSYEILYSPKNDLMSYLVAASIGKKTEVFLRNIKYEGLTTGIKGNVKFYIIYLISVTLTKTDKPKFTDLRQIQISDISKEVIQSSFDTAYKVYEENVNEGRNGDRFAKSNDFMAKLDEEIKKNY